MTVLTHTHTHQKVSRPYNLPSHLNITLIQLSKSLSLLKQNIDNSIISLKHMDFQSNYNYSQWHSAQGTILP